MGPLGWQETIFIFLLALLVFGPKKLPELGKTIGKAMTEFRRASSELKSTFDREMSNLERETEPLKEAAKEINYDSYNYDSSTYDSGSTDYGSYGYETGDSTATNTSIASASAPQGAESMTAASPEGTVASGQLDASPSAETVKEEPTNGHSPASPGEVKPVNS